MTYSEYVQSISEGTHRAIVNGLEKYQMGKDHFADRLEKVARDGTLRFFHSIKEADPEFKQVIEYVIQAHVDLTGDLMSSDEKTDTQVEPIFDSLGKYDAGEFRSEYQMFLDMFQAHTEEMVDGQKDKTLKW